MIAYESWLLLFFSGRVASNISSGYGEYSLFHVGSVISKRVLGQPGFSDFGLRCVSSTGLFYFSLIRKCS